MSLGVSLALYATARKALGQPLTFPGSSVSFNLPYDHSTESIGLQADSECNEVDGPHKAESGLQRISGTTAKKMILREGVVPNGAGAGRLSPYNRK